MPQGTDLPYLTLRPVHRRATGPPAATRTETAASTSSPCTCGRNARGKKQAHEIIGAIRTALHDQPLTLTGHRLVNLRHEFSEARRDPDGETIHGIARFRAVTEPA